MSWLLLALIFYVPGVYLEWPSDPWEHLRRINEWRILETVDQHSWWYKSGYFIPYSMLSWCVGPKQFFCLDFYYTGVSILLCWQYYRLARACGLSQRGSMIFVVLQALMLGNNIFSFYRYYGISTTVFAQVGAIAFMRIVTEAARRNPGKHGGNKASRAFSSFSLSYGRLLFQCAGVFALCFVIAFNHAQGLPVAAIGSCSVAAWRIVEWRRSMIFVIFTAVLVFSIVALLFFPLNPALNEIYRPTGYLTRWYGFNLFSPGTPAWNRSLNILGCFGACNLVVSISLARDNHITTWLAWGPIVLLGLPFVAIPLSNFIAVHNREEIVAFHRMLLAIPPGMALVAFSEKMFRWFGEVRSRLAPLLGRNFANIANPGFVLLLGALGILMVLPSSGPSYNRIWHSLTIVASDIRFQPISASLVSDLQPLAKDHGPLFTSPGQGNVLSAMGIPNLPITYRLSHTELPNARTLSLFKTISIYAELGRRFSLLAPTVNSLHSPYSIAGSLSGHWSPFEVALDYATASEMSTKSHQLGGVEVRSSGMNYFIFKPTAPR